MKTLTGTYYKGRLKLDQPLTSKKPLKVTVTFEDESKTSLTLSDFSFAETQKLLKNCKTSFSDEVIEERRNSI